MTQLRRLAGVALVLTCAPVAAMSAQSSKGVANCLRSSVASGMAGGLTGLAGIPKISKNLTTAFLGSTVLACTTTSAVEVRNVVLGKQLVADVERFKKLSTVFNTERLIALGDAPGSQLRFGAGGLTFSDASFADISAAWLRNVLGSARTAQASAAFNRIAKSGALYRLTSTGRFAGSLAAFDRSGSASLATAMSADSAATDLGAVTSSYEATFAQGSPSSGRAKQIGADLSVRRALATNQRLTYAIADLRNMIDEIAAGDGSKSAVEAITAGVR